MSFFLVFLCKVQIFINKEILSDYFWNLTFFEKKKREIFQHFFVLPSSKLKVLKVFGSNAISFVLILYSALFTPVINP